MKKINKVLIGATILFLGGIGVSYFAPLPFSFGATSVFVTQQGGTGTSSPSGILYGDNGATSHVNTVKIGTNLTFSGGTLSASGGSGTVTQINTTFPIQGGPITTSGTLTYGGLSTTSLWTQGQLAMVSGTSQNQVGSVATTTLSGSGVISVTAGAVVIGGSPITVACSTCGTGSVTSITQGTGMLFSPSPITTTGTIALQSFLSTSTAETNTRIPFWTSTAGTPAALSGGDAGFTWTTASAKLTVTNASSTSLTVTNGALFGTTGSFVGIATTSPWALLSINPSGLSVPAFAIGSTTKTLFQVNPGGQVGVCEQDYGSTGSPATSTAMVIDWANTCPLVVLKVGTAAFTVTFINATTSNMAGSRKMVEIDNPGTTAGALTWGTVIQWPGGTLPTQTTTASQSDTWSFYITSATSSIASPSWKVRGAMSAGFQ